MSDTGHMSYTGHTFDKHGYRHI